MPANEALWILQALEGVPWAAQTLLAMLLPAHAINTSLNWSPAQSSLSLHPRSVPSPLALPTVSQPDPPRHSMGVSNLIVCYCSEKQISTLVCDKRIFSSLVIPGRIQLCQACSAPAVQGGVGLPGVLCPAHKHGNRERTVPPVAFLFSPWHISSIKIKEM